MGKTPRETTDPTRELLMSNSSIADNSIDPCRDWSGMHSLPSSESDFSDSNSDFSDTSTDSMPKNAPNATASAATAAPTTASLEDCIDPCRDWSQMHVLNK